MSERKTEQIITRVSEDDRAWVEREAAKRGLDTSSFIRMSLKHIRHQELGARDLMTVLSPSEAAG